MNITTFATSLASSKLPDSLASFSFSGGQSAISALMTGPGEIEPHANAVLEHLASHRLNEAIDRPLRRRIDRLPWRRKVGRQGTRDNDVTRPALDHVRKHVVDVLHHDVDIQVQHPVHSVRVGIDQVAADVGTRICVQDV
jgi:hypothetical protein